MKASLIQVERKGYDGCCKQHDLNPWYFNSLFPLKFNPTLNYKNISADFGASCR